MANRKEYAYQIKGKQLSIVEKDFTTTDGLNYTYSGVDGDGITDDIPSGSSAFKSPLSSVTEGIEVEYVPSAVFSTGDESEEINLPSYLCKALVYYVRAKLAEDALNMDMREYFMREFRRMLEKHESAKVAGPRRIMPGSHAIR